MDRNVIYFDERRFCGAPAVPGWARREGLERIASPRELGAYADGREKTRAARRSLLPRRERRAYPVWKKTARAT